MMDIFNKVMTFSPNEILREQRITPELYTELIERDFPMTTSKDPRERYLGLRDMDAISKGRMFIKMATAYVPLAAGRKVSITDTAVRRYMRGEDTRSFTGEYSYTEIHAECYTEIHAQSYGSDHM